MIEQVDIETCRTLHQLRFFGDLRTINVDGDVLFATERVRVENETIPRTSAPSLHEVSDWLRKKKKIDIRIECKPRATMLRILSESSLWKYSLYRNKGKECIKGNRYFSQYRDALNGAITHALEILQQ